MLYYTSCDSAMPFGEFVETEVEDRGNYPQEEVDLWIEKYKIDKDNTWCVWVSTDKHMANRYNLLAQDWDKYKSVPDNEINVHTVDDSDGFIIPESDDGDEGFLFVFTKTPDFKYYINENKDIMTPKASKKEIAELVYTFTPIEDGAAEPSISEEQIADEMADKFNAVYTTLTDEGDTTKPFDPYDEDNDGPEYTKFLDVCKAIHDESAKPVKESEIAGGYMSPEEFFGHLTSMGNYGNGIDEEKLEKGDKVSINKSLLKNPPKEDVYGKIEANTPILGDNSYYQICVYNASTNKPIDRITTNKFEKINEETIYRRVWDKNNQPMNEDKDPDLIPHYYKGTQEQLEADIKSLYGDGFKKSPDGKLTRYFDKDGDQPYGYYNPGGRSCIWKIPSKMNESFNVAAIISPYITDKTKVDGMIDHNAGMIYVTIPFDSMGTIDDGEKIVSLLNSYTQTKNAYVDGDKKAIVAQITDESKKPAKNLNESKIPEAVEGNEKIGTGMCTCTVAPMGEGGLEGFEDKTEYKYEKMSKGQNGKPYFRLYHDDGSYETCGSGTFSRFFKIKNEAQPTLTTESATGNTWNDSIENAVKNGLTQEEADKAFNIIKPWINCKIIGNDAYYKIAKDCRIKLKAAFPDSDKQKIISDNFINLEGKLLPGESTDTNESTVRDIEGNVVEPMDSVIVTDPAAINVPVNVGFMVSGVTGDGQTYPDGTELALTGNGSTYYVKGAAVKISKKANELKIIRPLRNASYVFDARKYAIDHKIEYKEGLPAFVMYEEVGDDSKYKFTICEGARTGVNISLTSREVKNYIYLMEHTLDSLPMPVVPLDEESDGWVVVFGGNNHFAAKKSDISKEHNVVFSGTKEECESYIDKNKSLNEEGRDNDFVGTDKEPNGQSFVGKTVIAKQDKRTEQNAGSRPTGGGSRDKKI